MSKWEFVKLKEILRHQKGNSRIFQINDSIEYKLCRVQVHRKGVLLRKKQFGYEIKTKKQQLCHTGDLIVAEMDAKFGGYGFIPPDLEGSVVSSHYYLYELDYSKVTQEYLEVLINTDYIQNQIEAKGSTNYSSIRAWEFLEYIIPLPSLELQKSISKRFRVFADFKNELTIELNKQEKYVSQLKKAILQEAIAGQLTAEWRTQNPMKKGNPDTDAAALLAQIKAEKQQLIADGKLKKEKPLPEIAIDEIPFSLPDSWVWCRLGNITTLITDGKHGDCQNEAHSGYYFLSAKDIKSGKLVYENSRQITFKDFAEVHKRTNLEAGDICLVNTGATIGKTAIVPSHEFTAKTTFQKSVAVIKVLKRLISIQYLEKILISETSKLLEISKGSAINNLLLGDLRNQLIPLPPLGEQKAIAEKVDRLMETIDQLEQQIKHRKQLAEDLMQTVLREAFE